MSRARKYEWKGEEHTLGEWSRIVGIPRRTLFSRIEKYQWEISRALTEPVQSNRQRLIAVDKYVPKPKKEKKITECTNRCKRCYYSSASEKYVYCMYTAIVGHRRGCPAGDECTKFSGRVKPKQNCNGLIRRNA